MQVLQNSYTSKILPSWRDYGCTDRGLINIINRGSNVRSIEKARKCRHPESPSQAGIRGQEVESMAFPWYLYSLLKCIPVQTRYLLLLPWGAKNSNESSTAYPWGQMEPRHAYCAVEMQGEEMDFLLNMFFDTHFYPKRLKNAWPHLLINFFTTSSGCLHQCLSSSLQSRWPVLLHHMPKREIPFAT